MKVAPKPQNEEARLKSLSELEILDTALEEAYDKITSLAAKICDVPICLISLIDKDRQWFKSRHGLDATETPRDYAFCAHAILDSKIFEVKNALEDERFFDNPLVVQDPKVIFYTGAVLKALDNQNLGTLCVIDHEPRELNEFQKETLQTLADQVVSMMELRRHLRRLDEVNKNQTRFFASISHEIRTPLNGIIGMLDLLKDTPLSDEQNDYVKTVQNCGSDLVSIVSDILDLSKIDAGKLTIESRSFNICESCEQVIQLFEGKAKENKNELAFSVSPDFYELVVGDNLRFKQILINLVSNAIKFTRQGKINVELSKENQLTVLKVIDNGIGISKEQQDHLFIDFNQAESSTAKNFGGTGLGLAICKKLAELMGGSIALESVHGEGSTFIVKLKLQ